MGLVEKLATYQNARSMQLQNAERQRLADLQTGMTNAAQNPNITTMQMQPEQPQLSLSALGRQMQPQQFQPVQAEVSPVVDAYRDGRMQTQTVKRSPELAAFEYLRQNDPVQAQKYADGVLSQARNIALNGDHKGAVDFANKSLGLQLQYAGSKDDVMTIANGDGTHILYNVRTGEEQTLGKPKPMAVAPGSVIYDPQSKQPVFTAPKNDETWGDPYETTVGGKRVMLQKSDRGQIKPVVQDTSTTVKVDAGGGGMGKLDFESGKALVKGLPKLKEEAIAANGSIDRIDSMLGLIKGGVGGKKGQILSTLAPYAELAGVNTAAMNDAQTYEIMAKTIGGSMRMQIVGPGPVSNYENQLLQKISGGGSAATTAATELLSYYRKMAQEKVDDYNGSVEAVSEFSPATRKMYKPIGGRERSAGDRQRSTAPVVSYFKGNASKFAQDKMVQQLRKSGWSDAEIGAAWAEYKRGR